MVLCGNAGHAERLLELIGESCPFVTVYVGFLYRGFIDKENKRVVYTDAQIFSRQTTKQSANKKISTGQSIPSYDALTPGDLCRAYRPRYRDFFRHRAGKRRR